MIAGCHENKEGHASVLKTFQKVRERFYWPGMFMDVQQYLKFCPECGLNAQKRSKAPITQHIEANAPGETVVMDLLHYSKDSPIRKTTYKKNPRSDSAGE